MSYASLGDSFENELEKALTRLLDTTIDFTQCDDDKICELCDFNVICRR